MTFLSNIRVIELGGIAAECTGRLMAGLGADVIKIESDGGSATRALGPFVNDEPHPDRSLSFWHYNVGKRSVVAGADTAGRQFAAALLRTADVIIDARPTADLDDEMLGVDALRRASPHVVYARVSPFGDDGPWRDFIADDLIHLALGGMMSNCGYDRELDGEYRTPPIAPQSMQSYQIAADAAVFGVLAALNRRAETGEGERVDVSVHDAVAKNTEQDVPNWLYRKVEIYRQTGRHASTDPTPPALTATRDGRHLVPYRTYLRDARTAVSATVDLLEANNAISPQQSTRFREGGVSDDRAAMADLSALVDALVAREDFDRDLWMEGQRGGMPWAPVRRPEENLDDDHWSARETFQLIEHEDIGHAYRHVAARWYCGDVPWARLRRPPRLGEHNDELRAELAEATPSARETSPAIPTRRPLTDADVRTPGGSEFTLGGLRILDLSWLLASGGAGRFFTSLGAEVIKVEHSSRWDGYRWGVGRVNPDGIDDIADPNRSGAFMDINAGKRSVSLNLKTERGRELLGELVRWCDVVVEGFSPGTMDRMGFGYERLRELNPSIIYVQQSGMGQHGTYGRLRSYGPTAQALSGLTELSGLPTPAPPAGIGYSYLDWFGAYNMAIAVAAALHRRGATGEGCHIDASQAETGIYLTGPSILDYQVNGRSTQRTGNGPRGFTAAPYGAFRTAGRDRWIAIACRTDAQWLAVREVLGDPDTLALPEFATIESRALHNGVLADALTAVTSSWDSTDLMLALQSHGVPAGVCQNAQDRCETDPQLRHLGWLVALPQRTIGTWPIKEVPFRLERTPPFIGGRLGQAGPDYGQDNEDVLGRILGLSIEEIIALEAEGIIENPRRAHDELPA